MRECKKCGQQKELEDFRKAKNRKKEIYFRHECKECLNKPRRNGKPRGRFSEGNTRQCKEYKEWRKKILERDDCKCVKCGSLKNLHCHHIKSWNEREDLRFSIENGEVLCATCHIKIGKENKEINGENSQFKSGQKAINPFQKGHKTWSKGKELSKETKDKLKKAHLGRRHSPKSEFKKGQIPWNKGMKMTKAFSMD